MRADLRILFVVACASTIAPAAMAQSSPDEASIKFGPVGINPTFVVRNMGVDNNVFNDAQNPKSDFTMTLIPGVQVLFQPRRLTFSFTASSDYVYFQTYTSQRSTNGAAAIRGDVDLGIIGLSASASGINTRERLNAEIDERARHHDTRYTGSVSVHLATRTTVTATVRQSNLVFDPGSEFRGEDLAVAMNSRINGVDGTLGLQLTPFTKFEVIVGREHQTFDTATERNSKTWRVAPTFTFSPGALLTGSATVGYRQTTGESVALQDYRGLVASANVTALIVGRYQLQTGVLHDLRYSYERATPYFILTGITETLTTMLPAGFDVVGSAGWQRLAYRAFVGQPDPGDDHVKLASAGAGYHVRQKTRVGVTYEWSDRNSPEPDRNYQNHRLFATLTWGTTQ